MFHFPAVLFLLLNLAFSLKNVKSSNYVHNFESETVYATDVCMQMSGTSNYYSKFTCHNDPSMIPNVTTYSSSDCASTSQAATFRMDDPRIGNISFSFDCNAECSGCYVEYVDNCFNSSLSDQTRIYAPIDTCIVDVTQSYAYQFECGTKGMIYKEFTSLTCDAKKLLLTKEIFDCTLISDEESYHSGDRYFEFASCNLAPTNGPTLEPSMSPIDAPSNQPTQKPSPSPTFDVPFFNKSFDEILEFLERNVTEKKSSGLRIGSSKAGFVLSAGLSLVLLIKMASE